MDAHSNYTIIEDIFEDDSNNLQITAARNFIGHSHVPDDMKSKYTNKPQLMNLQKPPPCNLTGIFESPKTIKQKYIYLNEISPMLSGMRHQQQRHMDTLQCRDVYMHVENCPICSNYFKKDVKFYWMIIGILILTILLLTRNGK